MTKPLIGIPVDAEKEGSFSNRPYMALRFEYPKVIEHAGGIPVMVPFHTENVSDYIEKIDGWLLPGSDVDTDPALYGQEPHPATSTPWPQKDTFLNALCRELVEHDIPMLAICAGHQSLNVAMGGTLIQHIPEQVNNPCIHQVEKHLRDCPAHSITVFKGTRLHEMFGADTLEVNSSHHQGVDRLADCFKTAAEAPDGVIEAYEHPKNRFCFSVQWHAEYETNPQDQLLMKRLIAAASD